MAPKSRPAEMEKEPEIPNEAEGGGKKKKKKKSKKRGAGSTAKPDKANNEGGTSKKQEKRKKLKTADKKSGGGTKMNRANRRLNDWNQEWRVEGYPPQRSGGTAAWAEAGDGLLPTPDGSFNKCGGGGGWDQQSRDHQVPPPWNPGWNNAGSYHEGSWGYYENYNYKNPAAFDNYHWGKYPTNEWSNKNNSRHYRDYRQATRHPYHRDPRPANHGTDRRFHGKPGGAVHNARRYLEQRRLQEKKKSDVSRADNWGNETATAREKEIAEEEERKNKEAKCKVEDLKKKLKAKVTTSVAAATSTSAGGEADAGFKTELPSTSEPVINRLNHSDIVLSNEDFMLVGRGSVVDQYHETAEAPDVDPVDTIANSRVDDDLTSYARSREALQSICSASTFSASRSRVANLPHSRPTLPAEQDDDDDMQEEEEDDYSDAESAVAIRDRSDTRSPNDAKYSPLERLASFEEDRFQFNFREKALERLVSKLKLSLQGEPDHALLHDLVDCPTRMNRVLMLRLLQSHRTNVSKELNRLRFHWGTRTAREEEDSDNIGAVERDGDDEVVDWDSLPDDLLRRVGELVNVGAMPPPPQPPRPKRSPPDYDAERYISTEEETCTSTVFNTDNFTRKEFSGILSAMDLPNKQVQKKSTTLSPKTYTNKLPNLNAGSSSQSILPKNSADCQISNHETLKEEGDILEEVVEVPVPPKPPAPTVTLDDAVDEVGGGDKKKKKNRRKEGKKQQKGTGDDGESAQENPEESSQQSKLTVLRLLSEQEEALLGQLQEIEARRADVMREIVSIGALRAAVLRDDSGD